MGVVPLKPLRDTGADPGEIVHCTLNKYAGLSLRLMDGEDARHNRDIPAKLQNKFEGLTDPNAVGIYPPLAGMIFESAEAALRFIAGQGFNANEDRAFYVENLMLEEHFNRWVAVGRPKPTPT
jgi:hypothetical protein